MTHRPYETQGERRAHQSVAASREYHSEWDNPVKKQQTLYAFTDNWILTPEISEHPKNILQTIRSSRKTKAKEKKEKSLC